MDLFFQKRASSLTNKNNNWAPASATPEITKVTPSLAKVREAGTVSLPKVMVHRLETGAKEKAVLNGPNKEAAAGQGLTDEEDTSTKDTDSDASLVGSTIGLNKRRANRKLWMGSPSRDSGGKKSKNGFSGCAKG